MLAALVQLRDTFVLEKPILVGNGSVKALLDGSSIGAANYPAVAAAFLAHRSFGADFWADVRSRPADFGGAAALDDFEATVRLGEIRRTSAPTAAQLKIMISSNPNPEFTAVRDLRQARSRPAGWVDLLTQGGGQVPPGTDGADHGGTQGQLRRRAQGAERAPLPTVRPRGRGRARPAHDLSPLDEIETFVDGQPDPRPPGHDVARSIARGEPRGSRRRSSAR